MEEPRRSKFAKVARVATQWLTAASGDEVGRLDSSQCLARGGEIPPPIECVERDEGRLPDRRIQRNRGKAVIAQTVAEPECAQGVESLEG